MFECFEEILMTVISSTSHDEDIDNYGKERKSDAERFDDAMEAIFGQQYERQFQETDALNVNELWAINLRRKEMNLRAAVKSVVQKKLPAPGKTKGEKDEYNKQLNMFYDQARRHFEREGEHYEDPVHIHNLTPIDKNTIIGKACAEDRKRIFKALRLAGWPI